MKQKLTTVKSIEYDVELAETKKQPDLEYLIRFINEDKHSNMVIEYEDKNEAQRRRMSLRAWLAKSDYANKYYMTVRKNKLYIIKEKGSVDLSISG